MLKYFAQLIESGVITTNPAFGLRVKGKLKTVIQNPLSYEQLNQLYNAYKALPALDDSNYKHPLPASVKKQSALTFQRNIVILGLMIWQGLHAGELQQLEINHVNMDEASIYIPATGRGNSRNLVLEPRQILALHSFLYGGIRDQLKPIAGKLFSGDMHNIMTLLIKSLQGINPQIRNAQHIRASVFLHWLRQHNKRQVQYMAGHKYIDSIEAYAVQELETLTDQLQRYHPFG